MARRRKGDPIHGWIVLDKPLGMSSAQAVARVRHLFHAAKAGHAGTLDPLATGVLPIALGEATKAVPYVMAGAKLYRFTLRWGIATDTDDSAGKVISENAARPTRDVIETFLPRFTGTIMQTPPAYSALKIAGARAYDRARRGDAVTLAPRPVAIDSLVLVACPDPDHAEFEARVGKGTYIRALARDLGAALGTCGHVSALRRLAVGRFTIADAIPLENLANRAHSSDASEHLLSVETALDDIPALAVTAAEAASLRHGRPVIDAYERARRGGLGDGVTVAALMDGRLVAFAELDDGRLRPIRVLILD